MATDPIVPKNARLRSQLTITGGGGSDTKYIATNPLNRTFISVYKDSESADVWVTHSTKSTDDGATGDPTDLTDLESADVVWIQVSESTDDYLAGGDRAITGVKVTSNPTTNDVVILVHQYDKW